MRQLGFTDIEYFFRLDFGIYSRYTKNFKLESIPGEKDQALMVQIYFTIPEIAELKEKHGLTGFELCKSNYFEEDYNF